MSFAFEVSPVDRKLIHTLAETAFTDAAHNAVLVGGPGTGKAHLATAIGVSGIPRHGKRVRFYSTVDQVNAVDEEAAQGQARPIATGRTRRARGDRGERGSLPVRPAGGPLRGR